MRVVRVVVLGRVGIGPLDLDEAFGADGLVATPSHVQVGRVVKKADRALGGVFVQECFEPLAVDEGVFGQHDLLGRHISLRVILRRRCQGCESLRAAAEEGR